MGKKKKEEQIPIDFKDVTPKLLIGEKEQNPLYVKAFLENREENMSEYAQNTTTWDQVVIIGGGMIGLLMLQLAVWSYKAG